MTEPLEPEIEEARPRTWPSPVWAVPVVAILVALGLLWQSMSSRGPVIEITFPSASGLKAGETEVRYRDVTVGKVESLGFGDDLATVIATVRMDKQIAPWLDEDAQFWIVRPQVSAQGISGLETVLSGSYIEADWNTEQGAPRTEFTALDAPPLTPTGTPGTRVRLVASDGGSLGLGAPVLFKRVEVGRVEAKRLTADGRSVEFDLFIEAPHDRRLTQATRFWNTSGIDLRFGADGARVHIESIASLIRGGVSFGDLPGAPPDPLTGEPIFQLYASEGDAREQVINEDTGTQTRLVIEFDGSVRGLRAGAPVEYRGIKVGQVLDVTARIDPENGVFRTQTIIALQPTRLGVQNPDPDLTMRFLKQAVTDGLRAKLAMGNLLTGSLFVNLVDAPDAPVDQIDETAQPYPRLPSVASDLDALTGSVEGVLDRVDRLPIEQLMANAVALLDNANRLMSAEETQAIPGQALAVLEAAEALAASPDLQRSPQELAALLAAARALVENESVQGAPADIGAILASARTMLGELETGEAARNLAGTIAALRALTESPEFQALPGEAQRSLTALSTLINNPDLQAIPDRALAALTAAEALIANPETQRIPAEAAAILTRLRELADSPDLQQAPAKLASALTRAEALLAGLDDGGAAQNLSATLAALRTIVEDPETAALPGAANQALAALRALAENPDLTETPRQINATLTSIRGLIDDPALRAIPGEVTASLTVLRSRLDDPGLQAAIAGLEPLIADARAVLTRLEGEATPALRSLREILDAPGTRATPQELAATLASARALLDDQGLRAAAGEAAETLRALRQILDQPSARAAPEELANALGAARKLLTSLEQADAAGNLAATLQSARTLLDDPSLRRLSDELAGTAAALRQVLSAPGADKLPQATADALAQAAALIEQFRRENIGAATAGALEGVEDATRAVQRATRGLPALIARLDKVAKKADALLASVSVGSELNYEAVTAIREIRDAARAVTDLADLVQRQPNSLILGK